MSIQVLKALEIKSFPTKASTVYEEGDLLYWDSTGYVLPASSTTWGTSDAATQRVFAALFVGVCMGKKSATDFDYATTRPISVAIDALCEATLDASTSTTAGLTLITVDGNGSSTLYDNVVEDTTDPYGAIGIAANTISSATTGLRFRVFRPAVYQESYAVTKIAGAGDLLTTKPNRKHRYVSNMFVALETAVTTNPWVLNAEKGTSDISGAVTCLATGSAIGQVNEAASFTPTELSVGDTLSIEQSSSVPGAASGTVILEFWDIPPYSWSLCLD